jgi:hypothetical protein
MACNSFVQRSLREKSCREPQILTNQIGNPLLMIVAALVWPETTVGMIAASATHSPAIP